MTGTATPAPRSRLIGDSVADPFVSGIVGIVICVTITVAGEPLSRPVDSLAYLLGLGVGMLLLARRRWPVGVLVASAALVTAYHVLNYPAIGMAFPMAVALYSAAAAGHAVAAAAVCITLLTGTVAWWVAFEDMHWLAIVTGTVQQGMFMAVVVLLGDTLRSRRSLTESTHELLRTAEAEREQEAQRRVAEERLRLARELHDVTAHTVTVIGVQADVAAEMLDEDVEATRGAIEAVRTSGQDAVSQLQTTLDVLRQGGGYAPRAPAPGLAQLDNLLETMRRSGLEVEAMVTGRRRPLPTTVDLTAYRLVQESLTNVLRHADDKRVQVMLRYASGALHVTVRNRGGRVEPADASTGYGIVGMTERVRILGGELHAGPHADGGFHVDARIPAPEWT